MFADIIKYTVDFSIAFWKFQWLGFAVGRIVIALSVLLFSIVIRRIFTHFFTLKLLNWLAKRHTHSMQTQIVKALRHPISVIPILAGFHFAVDIFSPSVSYQKMAQTIQYSVTVLALFWAVYRLMVPLKSFTVKHFYHHLHNTLFVDWGFKVLKGVIVFTAASVILEQWGIKIAPILAGLGLFGAAIALGAQDFFKNLIAGMSIIAEKRFKIGDWIKVEGGVEGNVETIGFRSTCVRRFDKAPVHVPNSHLSDVAVVNFTRMTARRINWSIGVTYQTTTQQLQMICEKILDYIKTDKDFYQDFSPVVRVNGFAHSSIDILIHCFTRTKDWQEWLAIKEKLALRIKHIVEDEVGAVFAFPSQSLYIENFGELTHSFVRESSDK